MELYLVDTNVLLRLANPEIELHTLSQSAIAQLLSRGCKLHYTLQNAAEFWNVSTRPQERNGHGISPRAASLALGNIEEGMTFLPDDDRVYALWRDLVTTHNVRGVQVSTTLASPLPCSPTPFLTSSPSTR